MTKKTRTLVVGIIVAVAIAFMPMLGGEASAATKKPAKPTITSAKVSGNAVTIKWGEAKNAKKYQVGIQSAKKKWIKVKTVKKNVKNKKKFTKKNKYKVKAKGKKYIVYQYMFTYSKKKTVTKRSYKFTDLEYSTNYKFSVRAVNGKKYSGWRTVKRKTAKDTPWDDRAITEKGAKVTTTIGGVSNTLTIGTESTFNLGGNKGMDSEFKSIKVTPTAIQNEPQYGSLNVWGTINGLEDSWYCDEYTGTGQNRTLMAGVWDSPKAGIEIGRGYWIHGWAIKVTKPNIKAYWTLDGTEPKPGQADLTVPGNEYPLGTLDRWREYSPEPETIHIRGTVSNGQTGYTLVESSATYINSCTWVKVYDGNTLIGELYHECPWEQFYKQFYPDD